MVFTSLFVYQLPVFSRGLVGLQNAVASVRKQLVLRKLTLTHQLRLVFVAAVVLSSLIIGRSFINSWWLRVLVRKYIISRKITIDHVTLLSGLFVLKLVGSAWLISVPRLKFRQSLSWKVLCSIVISLHSPARYSFILHFKTVIIFGVSCWMGISWLPILVWEKHLLTVFDSALQVLLERVNL